MKLSVFLLTFIVLISICVAKRKRKFEGDFEFAEEENIPNRSEEKKTWMHDASSDLCRPLKCKKKEICLLEDASTAVCVSRKELKKNGDIVIPKTPTSVKLKKEDDVFYDTEEDVESENDYSTDAIICKPCPVVKPIFLCGADNKTYSSLCRLDYHNCIHHTNIKVDCKGFCPCLHANSNRKQRQLDKVKYANGKHKSTTEDIDSEELDARKLNRYLLKSELYTYTPQDFKYDNKHYKYIKYTKHNKNNILYTEDKERLRGYNEILDNKIYSGSISGTPVYPSKQCPTNAIEAMGDRLLDWFSVVMSDVTKRRKNKNKSKVAFPPVCKPEVRWMFQHLDVNGDGILSLKELYDLEHDKNEVCLKPFLQRCDVDGDLGVNSSEWCKCFQKSERPCTAAKHKITGDTQSMFVPDCDKQGYYLPIQCHSAIGMCWCVDKHGVEFANSRTRAKPNCQNREEDYTTKYSSQIMSNNVLNSSDDEEDDTDQDIEGSADHPPDY